jgi:hypothetical protein
MTIDNIDYFFVEFKKIARRWRQTLMHGIKNGITNIHLDYRIHLLLGWKITKMNLHKSKSY